jgi:hypothetical protein
MFLKGLIFGLGFIIAMILFAGSVLAFCLLRDCIQARRFWGKLAQTGPGAQSQFFRGHQTSSNAAVKSKLRPDSSGWLQTRVQVAYKGMTIPLDLSDEDMFSRFV